MRAPPRSVLLIFGLVVVGGGAVGGCDRAGPPAALVAAALRGGGVHANATPSLDSFTPTSGSVGDGVSLSGSGFTGAGEVDFGGTSASFSVIDDATIIADVPDGAFSGPITVYAPGGAATSMTSFTLAGAPTISTLAPASGVVDDVVTITGTGFSAATQVSFTGAPAGFAIMSDTQILVPVPPAATSGPITVVTPAGSVASATSFTVKDPPPPLPLVSAFSPASGPPGTPVVVSGDNFGDTSEVTVGGVDAQFVIDADDQLSILVPDDAPSGAIAVTNGAGVGSSGASFTVESVTAAAPGGSDSAGDPDAPTSSNPGCAVAVAPGGPAATNGGAHLSWIALVLAAALARRRSRLAAAAVATLALGAGAIAAGCGGGSDAAHASNADEVGDGGISGCVITTTCYVPDYVVTLSPACDGYFALSAPTDSVAISSTLVDYMGPELEASPFDDTIACEAETANRTYRCNGVSATDQTVTATGPTGISTRVIFRADPDYCPLRDPLPDDMGADEP